MQRHLVFIDKITWWFFQKEREKKKSVQRTPTYASNKYILFTQDVPRCGFNSFPV